MRNIFLFIRRYSNLLFFLLLQIVSIYFIVRFSSYHNAAFSEKALEITGFISKQNSRITDFVGLKEENRKLREQKEVLLNAAAANFTHSDTIIRIISDSIPYDTLGNRRKWKYYQAGVVQNSTVGQNNYMVVSRGSRQGMKPEMGVIDGANGLVGKIVETSDNYSAIMSLIHKDTRISAKLYHWGDMAGTVIWDGSSPDQLLLTGLPKNAKLVKGDSVVTSGLTGTFRYGYLIGTVTDFHPEKSSNTLAIHIKPAVNFYTVQNVFAVENLEKNEIDLLEQKLKKK